jgi:hypothetical protein
MDKEPEVTIRELYPTLSNTELEAAEENLERYLELVLRIYERIRAEPESYAQFKALTASEKPLTCMPKGRFVRNLPLNK